MFKDVQELIPPNLQIAICHLPSHRFVAYNVSCLKLLQFHGKGSVILTIQEANQ